MGETFSMIDWIYKLKFINIDESQVTADRFKLQMYGRKLSCVILVSFDVHDADFACCLIM